MFFCELKVIGNHQCSRGLLNVTSSALPGRTFIATAHTLIVGLDLVLFWKLNFDCDIYILYPSLSPLGLRNVFLLHYIPHPSFITI